MTCNYQNSAGTDLDSLFLVDSSNGGSIGMQISSGQDLGNRFCKSSTLGYAVGYRNSAGTDLGYLRGNTGAPTLSSGFCTKKSGTAYIPNDSDPMRVYGYFNIGAKSSFAGTWEVQLAVVNLADSYASSSNTIEVWFNDNSTTTPNYTSSSARKAKWTLNKGATSSYLTTTSISVGTSAVSRNISYCILKSFAHPKTDNTVKLRILMRQRFYNSVGSSSYASYSFDFSRVWTYDGGN